MTSAAPKRVWKKGSSAAEKLRLLSSGSLAAATIFLASMPQNAQAQMRAPGMMVENQPHIQAPTLPSAHQPQSRVPAINVRGIRISSPAGFSPRDVRISAPISLPQISLPNAYQPHNNAPSFEPRDIKISGALPKLPSQDIRVSSPVTLPNANQPHSRVPDFGASEIRISSPVVSDLDTISISAPALVPGLDQPQAIVSTPGTNVLATAVYDDTALIFTPGAIEDLVTVSATEAIINWTTFSAGAMGTEVDFLPAGSRLRFTSDNPNYTVLNRVLTPGFDSAIRIDGTVLSDFSGTGATAGNIWFYSPGGIVAGASSIFDVGSLILTANDIDTGGGLFGGSGEIRFRGIANSTSAVTVEAGASINAQNNGSYVALVAPRVVQDGTVNVNGSVAYVATEQADLTINNGLFDIAIPVGNGTTDANGIVHSGTTTGEASTSSSADAQAIYMVAVAKNAALTMLVGGNVGYQPAVSAGIENGRIVLSAGHNVSVDASGANPVPAVDPTPVNAIAGNVEFRPGTFSSKVSAKANGNITNGGSGSFDFTGDLTLDSGSNVSLALTGADQFTVDGDLNLVSAQNIVASHTGRAAGFNSFNVTGNFVAVAQDDIVLNDARISASQLQLQATNGSLLGNGQLVSADDVGITVAGDINANLIGTTNGQLTSFAAVGGVDENLFTAPGSISVGSYITGSGTRFRVEADSNINFGQISGAANNVELFAAQGVGGTGDVFLGTTTGRTDITLQGENVGFTDLTADGNIISNITILATNGDIIGGNAFSEFTLDWQAIGGNIDIGNIDRGANGDTILDATGDITVATVHGGNGLTVTAGGDFNFDLVDAFGIVVSADNIMGDDIASLGVTGLAPNNINITATGNLNITSATSTDLLNIDVDGTVTADSLVARSGATITVGSLDIDSLIVDQVSSVTTEIGDLDIGTVDAAFSLNLTADNGSIIVGDVDSGGTLRLTASNGSVDFADITASSLAIIGGDVTGNDVTGTSGIGSVSINSTGILTANDLFSAGNLDIDAVTANLGDVSITGTEVRVIDINAEQFTTGNLDSTLIINLTATNGSISTGTINSGGSIQAAVTGGNITTSDITGVSTLFVADGNIAVGDAVVSGSVSSDFLLNAGGTVDFTSISAGRIARANGTTINGGSVTSTAGFVDIGGTDVTLGDVAAAQTIEIDATAGDLSAGSLTAGSNITLTGSGIVSVNDATTSLDATITGGSVELGSADTRNLTLTANTGDITAIGTYDIVNDLRLNALAGDIDATGTFTIGRNIDLDAAGNIAFDSLQAQSSFTVNTVTGNISFVEARGNDGDIIFNAGGNISGGSILGGLAGNDSGSDNITLTTGGSFALTGTASALDTITVLAGGTVNADTLNALDVVRLTGTSVTVNDGSSGGDFDLSATAGEVNVTGTLTVDGLADFSAPGDINFGAITAGSGFEVISTGGDVTFVDANSGNGTTLITADGDITGVSAIGGIAGNDSGRDDLNLNAGGNISLTGTGSALDEVSLIAGGTINADTLNGTDRVRATGTSVTLNNASSGGNVILNALAGAINGTGTITVGGTADFSATDNITFGSITAGTGIVADTTNGDITFVQANAVTGDVSIDAVNIVGQSIATGLDGNDTGFDRVFLDATGNITLTGNVTALDGLTAVAGGALDIAAINITDAASLTGTSVTFDGGSTGLGLVLNATAGAVTSTADLTVGGLGNFDATTDINLQSISVGGGLDIDTTGGDATFVQANAVAGAIEIDAVNISGQSIATGLDGSDFGFDGVTLDASGTLTLAGAVSAIDNINISSAGALNLTGLSTIDSVILTGGAVTFTDATVGGFVNVDATGDINFNSITAVSGVAIDTTGGGVTLTEINTDNNSIGIEASGDISAASLATGLAGIDSGFDDITLTSGGNVSLTGTVTSLDDITVTATGTVTAETVNASNAVNLIGASVSVNNGTAGNRFLANATAGALTATTINATDSIDLTGSSIALGDGTAGIDFAVTSTAGDISITGASNVGRDLILNATGGDINAGETISLGRNVDLDATGDITFADLAASFFFDVDAGGDINFTSATIGGNNLTMDAGGDITGVDASNLSNTATSGDDSVVLTAGGDITLTGESRAERDIILTATNVSAANLTAAVSDSGILSINATGNVVVDNANTINGGGNTSINGATVTINNGSVGGVFAANGTTSLTIGSVAAGFGMDVDGGDINFTSLTTNQNDLTIDATSNVTGVDASNLSNSATSGSDDVQITAGGNITLTGESRAEQSIRLTAVNVDAANLTAAVSDLGTLLINATGSVMVDNANTINGAGNVDITGDIVTINNGSVGGNFAVNGTNATIGTDSVTIGSVAATFGVDIDSEANVAFTSLTTNQNNLTIDAVGDITGVDASNLSNSPTSADDSVAITAGGDITLTGLSRAEQNITLTGTNINAANLSAGFGTAGDLTVLATGAVVIDSITTTAVGSDAFITGGSVDINSATVRSLFTGNATAGNFEIDTLANNSFIDIDATANVVFDTITTTNGSVNIDATGNITGVTASNLSSSTSGADDVRLEAGGNIILTGGSRAETNVTLIGTDITAGTLTANGFGTLTVTGTGAVSVDNAVNTSSGADVGITGASVTINNSNILGDLVVTATAGDISGNGLILARDLIDFDATGDVTFGTINGNSATFNIEAGGDINFTAATSNTNINLTATGGINGGDLTAAGNLNLNGGNIGIGAASGNNINFTSATDILFDTITSPNAISLTALAGMIGRTAAGAGDITSTGASITTNSATTDLGTLDATTSISVTTTGIAIVDEAISATSTSITGATITLNSGDVGTDLTLNVTAGDLDGNGTLIVGGAIDFDATGDIGFGSLTAAGGAFDVNAGGDINFASATSTAAINLTAVGAVNGGDLNAGTALNLNGGNIAIGDAMASAINFTSATDILFDSITSPNAVSLTALAGTIGKTATGAGDITSTGSSITTNSATTDLGTLDSDTSIAVTTTAAAVVDEVISGTSTNVTGGSVTLNNGDVGTNLVLNATAGSVSGAGAITAGGAVNLDATADIGFGSLDAQGGTFTADAVGNIVFTGTASSSSTMTFNAGNNISGGTVDTNQLAANSTFTTTTGNVTLGDVTTRILTVDAGTDLTLGNVDAAGRDIRGTAIGLDAGGSINFTSLSAGRGIDIDATTGAVTGGNILADDSVNILSESISIGDVTNAEAFNITLNATAGDLTAGNVSNTTFGIVASATGAVTFGNVTVSGTANASDINITAGTDLTIGDADAGDRFTIDVGGNLVAGNLISDNISPGSRVTVTGNAQIASMSAANGPASLDIGGSLTGGLLAADGVLNITAASVDIDSATSNNNAVNITATVGDAIIDNTSSNFATTVTAAGLASIGNALSNRDLTLTGANVALNSGNITQDLTLNATAGNVAGTGTVTVGEAIDLDATGDITFGSLTAGTGFTANAGGAIAFTSANTNDNAIIMGAGSTLTGGSLMTNASGGGAGGVNDTINLTAGGALTLTGTTTSENGTVLAGDSVTAATLVTTSGAVTVTATNAANVGTINSANAASVTGGSVTLNNGSTGSALILNATNGDLDITGALTAGDTINLDATGDLTFTDATANANFNVDADGAIAFNSANSNDGAIIMDAGTTLTGVSLMTNAAGGGASGVNDTINLTAGGALTLTGTATSENGTVLVGDSVNAATLVNTSSGGIAVLTTNAAVVDTITSASAASITGGSVTLGSGTTGSALILNATNGDLNINGAITAGDTINLDATGDLTFTDATANANFNVDAGGAIAFTSANSNSGAIIMDAGTTLTGVSLMTNAAGGGSAGTNDTINLTAGGALTLTGTATSENGTALVGDTVTAATLVTTSGSVTVAATNAASVDIINSSNAASVTGTSAALNSGNISGNLVLNSTAGDIDGSGAITVGGAIDFNATGDVRFGSLTAGGGAFDIDAGGDINFVGATSTNAINMTAVGSINGGDLDATNALNLNGGNIAIGAAMASSINFSSATDILFDSITSPNAVSLTALAGTIGKTATGAGDITSGAGITLRSAVTDLGTLDATGVLSVTASGAAVIDNAIATLNSTIAGNSITLNNSDMDLSLTLNAGVGGITSGGTLDATSLSLTSIGGDVSLATTSTVSGTTVTADGTVDLGTTTASNIIVTAGTDLTASSLTATSGFGDSIRLTAGDALTLNSAQAPGILRLNADTINASNIDTGFIGANATGAIVLDNISATLNSTITGASVSLNDLTNDLSYTVTSTAGDISSTGTLTASNLVLDATGDINLGDATTVSTMNLVATGAIDFGTLTGSNLTLNAGTDLTGDLLAATSGFGGSMNLTAGNLIDVTEIAAPGSVQLDAASADIATLGVSQLITNISGLLNLDSTTLSSNTTITAGSITLGDLTNSLVTTLNATTGDVTATGALTGSGFNVNAANIQLATVEATGTTVTATAIGLVSIDTVNSASSTTITGSSITLNDGIIGSGIGGGNLTLNATAGDINGTGIITATRIIDLDATGDVNFGSLSNNTLGFNVDAGGDINFTVANSNNDITMTAVGGINGGDLTAVDTVTLNAGDISIGDAAAANINFTSALDILFDSITSPNAVSLTALGGTIGKTVAGAGDITSGGSIALNAASTNVGTLDAGTSIAVTTTGAAVVDSAISGTTTNITGAAITLNSGTIGTDLTLNVTAGDLDGSGAITVGGAIDFDATGDVEFGSLAASGGAFNVDAGGDINFTSATSTNSINMTAVGGIIGGDLIATNALNLDGGNIMIGDARSGSIIFSSAQDILFDSIISPNAVELSAINGTIGGNVGAGNINSGNAIILNAISVNLGTLDAATNIAVNATGAAIIDTAISVGNTAITGATVTLNNGTIGNDLTLNVTAGDLDGSGAITVGGAIDFDATGNVGFGSLTAGNGAFDVDAGGDINFAAAISTNDINMNAVGSINGGDLDATNTINLTANNIAIGDAEADSLNFASATDILFNSITSPNAVTLTAANGLIGKNTGSGDINSGGNIDLTSQSVDVGNLISGGNISADISLNDARFALLNAAGSVDIKGFGAIEILELNTGGDISLVANSSTLGAGVIGGNLMINNIGDINFAFDGTEQLTVAGTTTLGSGQNILISHTNNAASTISIDSTNSFTATATGDFNASSGSIINTGNELLINTGGSISADDLRAVPVISLTAGRDVLLNNATASGPQGVSNATGIIINAGFINISGVNFYDPTYNATLTGTITSYSDIVANAGGNIIVQTGADVQANDSITFSTGDDIIVQTGSSVLASVNPGSTPNPSEPFDDDTNLVLAAGALSGSLLSTPLTPLASIVIDGNIGANGSAVVMTAEAIDGLGGTIAASSIRADINNAPDVAAIQSDDNGLLSANCLQGNICLGFITADNRVEIGQNGEVVQAIIANGDVNARRLLVSSRNDIVLGTSGITASFNASDDLLLQSTAGDVNLFDSTLSSDTVQISAVNGSLLGSGAISSVNDIGIDVGADISATSINTGGELTSVANIGGAKEGFYSVTGNMTVGTLTVGMGDVNYDAGGNFNFGSIIVPNSDINLVSAGTTTIDSTSTAQNINIDASDISLGDITAANNVDLLAAGMIDFDDLTVGNALTMNAADINGLDVTAVDLTAAATNDFNVQNIFGGASDISADVVTIDTAEGNLIASGTSAVTVNTVIGGELVVQGGAVSIGSASSNPANDEKILVTIDGSDVFLGSADADNISITAANAITANTLTSSGDIDLTAGGAITSGDLNAADALNLNGSSIAIGNATGGSINFASANDIVFDSITSTNAITLTAANGLIGKNAGAGDINGGGDISLTSQSVDVGSIISGGDILANITASDAAFALLDAAGSVAITGAGLVDVTSVVSGTSTSLTGASVTLQSGTVGTDLTLNATVGDIDGTGAITVGGAIDFDAIGNVGFGSLTSNGGAFAVDAGGDINFTSATSADNIDMTAAGDINGGDLTAANALNLEGSNITLGDATATSINFTSGTDVLFNALTSTDALSLTAVNGTIGMNTGNGDIDSGGNIDLAAQAINVGNLTSGGSVTANAAAGDGSFGTIDAANDITISAAGTPTLTNAISGGHTSITGQSVALNNGTIGGDLVLNATAGDVDATGTITVGGLIDFDATGNVGFGTLAANGGALTVDAGGDINFADATSTNAGIAMTAAGSINGGDLDAANTLTLNGGNIAIGTASAGTIDFTSATDIQFDALLSPGAITLTAANGTIGMNTGDGDIDSDDDITLTAQMIDLGNITSGGSVSADATAGDANFGTIDAATDIIVNATGTPTLANVISGGTTTIMGQSVTLANGNIGGNLILNATTGDLNANGTITVGGSIDFDAAGNIDFGTLDAQGGDFSVDAGGNLNFTSVDAAGEVNLIARAGLQGGTVNSDDNIAVFGQTMLDVDTVTAVNGVQLRSSDGDVSANSVSGAGMNFFADQGTISIDTINASRLVTLDGDQGVEIGQISGTDVTIDAANGAIIVQDAQLSSLLTANGQSVFLRSTGTLQAAATATAGDIDIAAQSDLNVENADATGDITLRSLGGSTFVNVVTTTNSSAPVTSGGGNASQAVTTSGGNVTISAANNLEIRDAVSAAANLSITAGNLVNIQASASGINVDVFGADINIASTGQLGASDQTQNITITSDGTSQFMLGGTGTTGAFSLDADEFTRVHSGGDLTISALGTGSGNVDLLVQDLNALVASGNGTTSDGNIGTGGGLFLQAENNIRVDGALALSNAGSTNLLAINAGNDIASMQMAAMSQRRRKREYCRRDRADCNQHCCRNRCRCRRYCWRYGC